MKRFFIWIVISIIFLGCSSTNNGLNQKPQIAEDVYSPGSVYAGFKKYNNFKYKMVAIDTRVWENNSRDILATRKILRDFGNKLGNRAIVQNMIYKTSKKRAYFEKIQKKLSTHYSLDNDTPFLIFFKKSNHNTFEPYKIVSLASASHTYLKEKLELLATTMNSRKSNEKIYNDLEEIKQEVRRNPMTKTEDKRIVINITKSMQTWL